MTPSRSTPIANRAQTSATGVISRSAIFVATNEAPQTATANAALRSAPAFPELPAPLRRSRARRKSGTIAVEGGYSHDPDVATQEAPARPLALPPEVRETGLSGGIRGGARPGARSGTAGAHHPRRCPDRG